MFNKNIKLIIASLIFIWSIFEFAKGHIWNGIMIIFLAGIFVFFYFKNEILLLAFWKLRKQDFAGATKVLDMIKNPTAALVKKQQGYYNFLRGIMVSQTNLTQAEKFFKKALELDMSMDHDKAMANLQLAGIYLTKRRKREAANFLNEAKRLDKHGMLKDQVKMIKEQMKKV
jgi:hypothetical protein